VRCLAIEVANRAELLAGKPQATRIRRDCREPGSYILGGMSRRNGDRCKFHIARRRKLAKRVRMRAALAKLLLNRAA